MSDIEKGRQHLHYIADEIGGAIGQDIRDIINDYLIRVPAIRMTRNKRPGLTPELADKIRAWAAMNPEKSQLEIANELYTNPGRVSEALHFKDKK